MPKPLLISRTASPLVRRGRTSWRSLGLVAVLYLAIAGVYLAVTQWNFTVFAHLSPDSKVTRYYGATAGGLWVWPGGHDGTSYYAIARTPLHPTLLGQLLDEPLLRYRRILYPLLVHLVSLGQPSLIGPALVVVNLMATLAGVYVLQRLITPLGLSPLWAALFALHPAVLLSFLYDLPTALAVVAVLLGLLGYQRKKGYGWVAVGLSLALVTWEPIAWPIVLAWLGYEGFRWARSRGPNHRFPWLLTVPLVVGLAWEVVLKWLFPTNINAGVLFNFGYPGVGWWLAIRYWFTVPPGTERLLLVFAGLVAVNVVVAVVRFLASGKLMSTLALAQAALIFHLTPANIVWPLELTRKSLGLWLFTLLAFAENRDLPSRLILSATLLTIVLIPWWLPIPEARW